MTTEGHPMTALNERALEEAANCLSLELYGIPLAGMSDMAVNLRRYVRTALTAYHASEPDAEAVERDELPQEYEAGLRDRCLEFYKTQGRNAMMRQGSPPDDIMDFVIKEIMTYLVAASIRSHP